ncbi:MAG: hypothetical protein QN203_12850, partial [Armatimonadota bacterium]|nr:hypothetical protein [Armatimonadota bacterium]
ASIAAGVLVAGALARLWRVPPQLAAQVVDLRLGCADRLATAVEVLTGQHRPTALTDALVADAARTAASLDLRRGLAVRPPRLMALAVVVAVLAMASDVALVGLTVPGTPARMVVETIRREGRRLERSAEALEEQARLDRARLTRRFAPSLRALGQSLQRERLERQDALARLEALAKQVEAARRQVQRRASDLGGQPPPAERPSDLFRRRAAAERTLRQIREIAERLTQSRSPEERQALLRQLAALAGGGEDGDVPARARQQAAEAQRHLEAGDAAGARRALQQGASDLEDLRAMLADEEGLQQTQRDLQRSSQQIARGRPVSADDAEQTPQAAAQPGQVAPGTRPPQERNAPDGLEPPPGPNQGTTPGQGAPAEKLGERTPRLDADRQSSRVRGLQGEGRVTTSELLGPGRAAEVRAPQGPALRVARAEADRYMARWRIPPEYREIVRRYFEALAAQR